MAATPNPNASIGTRKREREILDAAAEMFHRHGYANTSVQQIANAVGLLKGSLYYYIDSKEDLLFRVLDEVHSGGSAIVEEVGALDAPPLEKLRLYIRRHIEYNASKIVQVAVYYHDAKLLSPDRRALILQRRKAYESCLVGLIEAAQAEGTIHPELSPSLLTNGILGATNWIYTWYHPTGPVSPQRLGQLYGDLLVDGMLPAAG